MLDTKEEISDWLNKYGIDDYYINEDLTVDVSASVNLSNKGLAQIEVRFNIVSGDFFCSRNNLTNLYGCPKEVWGDFSCNFNQLKNLKYSPELVSKDFFCGDNKLDFLNGSTKMVGGGFYCSFNNLKDLIGGPLEVGGDFHCASNLLNSLDGIPEKVGGIFNCDDNENLGVLEVISDFKEIKTQILKNNLEKLLLNKKSIVKSQVKL